MFVHVHLLWAQVVCFAVLFHLSPLQAHPKTRRQADGKEKTSKYHNSTLSIMLLKPTEPTIATVRSEGVIDFDVHGETAKHFKNTETNDSPTTYPKKSKSDGGGDINLAVLPILAVIIFIVCMCLKCCTWFREDVKQREGDCDVETGFVILNEGDSEYHEVEIRSDSTSVCYDTVSSYASFMKRQNNYDTLTSVRSLQLPRNSETYNSYRSFLLQRLDGSRHNSVNSYRQFLQKATEMKDVEVQVELLDISPRRPTAPPSHVVQKSLSIPNDQEPQIQYQKPARTRYCSCDAIVLSSRSSRSSESSEASNSPSHSPDRKPRKAKRTKQRVSFADSIKGHKVLASRSMSSADRDHSAPNLKNIGRRTDRQHSVSPLCSPKHIWASRFSPRGHANDESPDHSHSGTQQRSKGMSDSSSNTDNSFSVVVAPNKNRRFHVSKAVENVSTSTSSSEITKVKDVGTSTKTSETACAIVHVESTSTEGACALDGPETPSIDIDADDLIESVSNDCLKNACEMKSDDDSVFDMQDFVEAEFQSPTEVKSKEKCAREMMDAEKNAKSESAINGNKSNTIANEDSVHISNETNGITGECLLANKRPPLGGEWDETPCVNCGEVHEPPKSETTLEDSICSDDSDSGVCSEFLPLVHLHDGMNHGHSFSPE